MWRMLLGMTLGSLAALVLFVLLWGWWIVAFPPMLFPFQVPRKFLFSILVESSNWMGIPHVTILKISLFGAFIGSMVVGFKSLAGRITSGSKKMKQILVGTFLGLLSGVLFAVSLSVAMLQFDRIVNGTGIWPRGFWDDFVRQFQQNGFEAVLEGAGWGAVIGTLVMGFRVVNESIRVSAIAILKKPN